MRLAIPTALCVIAFIILPTVIAVNIRFAQGQDTIPNEVAKTTYPNLWQKVITSSGEPIPDRVNHFFSWQGGKDQCSNDKPCININGNGYCCNSVEKTELLPDYFLGIGNIYQKKPVSLCQVCNTKPILQGNNLGVLYRPVSLQFFDLNKFPNPANPKEGRLAGTQIKDYAAAERDGLVKISDAESEFSQLKFFLGDSENTLKEGLQYYPTPKIEVEDLPKNHLLLVRAEDPGGQNNAPKAFNQQQMGALLCPDGKVSAIKKGTLTLVITLGGIRVGKIVMTIKTADVTFDINRGNCQPAIDLQITFDQIGTTVMVQVLKNVDTLEPFDIKIPGVTMKSFENAGETQIEYPEFSVANFLKEIIKKYKMTEFKGTESTFTLSLKVKEENGAIQSIVEADGSVDKPWPWDNMPIKEKLVYNLKPEKVSGLIGQLIEKFKKAGESIDKSQGTFGEGIKVIGRTIPLGDKGHPIDVQASEHNFEGFPAVKTVWSIHGKTVKEVIEVLGKPYLYRKEYPALYKSYYNTFFKKENGFEIAVRKHEITGNMQYNENVGVANAEWNLLSGFTIEKVYDYKNLLKCCPNVEDMVNKVKILKESGKIKGKEHSTYLFREFSEPVDDRGIGYQFFPAYTFNLEVSKDFNVQSFEDPNYIREEDSFLDQCTFEILDEVRKRIGPGGGQITLGDDTLGLDKVGSVGETIPAGAVSGEQEFGIRRVRIIGCPCRNNLIDPGEEGIDCGGGCKPCKGSCSDGVQNQDETGTDIGGACIISSIPPEKEPCGWDANRDGITNTCVACTSDADCPRSSCIDYFPACRIGNCGCSNELTRVGVFSFFKNYAIEEESLFEEMLLPRVDGWVSQDSAE